MIRKQLYITSQQDDALKKRSRQTGKSEAEIVRDALDSLMSNSGQRILHRKDELDQLIESTKRISEKHHLPAHYRFNREEIYSQREERILKKG